LLSKHKCPVYIRLGKNDPKVHENDKLGNDRINASVIVGSQKYLRMRFGIDVDNIYKIIRDKYEIWKEDV
jgi:hypothetical protein